MKNLKRKEALMYEKYKEQRESYICNGGLLFRGDFYLNPQNEKGQFTWARHQGDEEQYWNESLIRLLILTKDLNDDEPWDIRQESAGRAPNSINDINSVRYLPNCIFYRHLCQWVWTIFHPEKVNLSGLPEDYHKLTDFYEKAPLARINCKIDLGGSSLNGEVLKKYIERDVPLLKEHIELYGANIILCCGYNKKDGGNIILNELVKKYILPDLQEVKDPDGWKSDEWVYYSQEKNIIVISTYHPSYWRKNDEWHVKELSQCLCGSLRILQKPISGF